jgi:hypothetical protein
VKSATDVKDVSIMHVDKPLPLQNPPLIQVPVDATVRNIGRQGQARKNFKVF